MKIVGILFLLWVPIGLWGQAVITLVMPPGSRNLGMGEVGAGLLDPAFSYYYNPALPGLSFPSNKRSLGWASFNQNLLPSFGIKNLYHNAGGIPIDLKEEKDWGLPRLPPLYWPGWGYIGLHSNYISFGKIPNTNDTTEVFTPQEQIFILTLSPDGLQSVLDRSKQDYKWDVNSGVNIKYISSELAPSFNGGGADDGIAESFAFDLGLASSYIEKIPTGNVMGVLGINFMNMGPEVYYVDPDQADPIPFTIKLGGSVSWSLGKWSIKGLPISIFKVVAALDASDEIVIYRDSTPVPFYRAFFKELNQGWSKIRRKAVWTRGFELTFFDVLSLRTGGLSDEIGERSENHIGWGVKVPFNPYLILGYDYYKIDVASWSGRADQEGHSFQFGIKF